MIGIATQTRADPDRGPSRTVEAREPSGIQQSNDDEAAKLEPHAGSEDHARRRAIAEAAYYRAQQRGFEPGQETQDWLSAEREIMEREGSGVVG
jgi:hypothetical protein